MRIFMTCILVLGLVCPAFAAFTGPGSVPAVTTVAQALQAADNASCVLTGNIVEKITGKSDKYVFKDSTGSVIVEIDNKIFAGRDVGPAHKVRLQGEVDKELTRPNQVDVKMLEILP